MSRLKIIFIHPVVVVVVCAAGLGMCRALGVPLHVHQMLIAGGICLTGAELAMIPVFVVRGKPADNAVQGALVSTVIHLGVTAGVGMAVLKMDQPQMHHQSQAFAYWLCALYWTTLAAVCRVLMQVVKSAPVPRTIPSMNSSQASEV
jgi:hypothetical protein